MDTENKSDKNDLYLLQEALDYDILSVDSVNDRLMAIRLEKVERIHPYAITPPPDPTGRWQTTYRDRCGNRKSIRARTREELMRKLIPVYFAQTHFEKLTFKDLFDEWIAYKSTVVNSPNTITRHKQHYNRYFGQSPINSKKVRMINDLELESLCNSMIRDRNMSRKEWNNVKTILTGMYSFAVRNGYTSFNPMDHVSIYVKFRQVVKKSGSSQTYNTEELKALNDYLDKMYSETEDLSFLAVRLNFFLGLRVGELVALKWNDIQGNKLHVVREEIRNQSANTTTVEEHTKTNRDRFVVLVPKALDILNRIERTDEYIFTRDNERITSRQVNYVLEKYAERIGAGTKSSHKIRKTYASNLSANGVPIDCIREQLGHSNLSTTLEYIYNPLTENETYELIKGAL